MSCNCNCGPCDQELVNTAACESLPSQIQNFTTQFFGEVIKTEIDGQVTWTLPCNLDVGLPNNARGADEGLACYFLRLFEQGIVGLTGPKGDTGGAGTDGRNAYTVTIQGFTQPSESSPNIQVLTAYNPAMVAGLYVFIQTSGYYQITTADTSGALFLTLVQALPGAPSTIIAGKLVIPSGVPGAAIVGPAGPAGPIGPAGNNATNFSTDNGEYFAPIGTDFPLPVVYMAVTFVNSSPVVQLSAAGVYRVTVVADVVGTAGVLTSDLADLKLRNTTLSTDIDGSEHSVSFLSDTQRSQIVIIAKVTTTTVNQQIALFGKCTTATRISVVALHTNMTYVRLS